jgi:hypothetical protein
MKAVWANVASRTALAPPSPEAKRLLACKSIDLDSGEVTAMQGPRRPITECFRVDRRARIVDTQYRLVSREGAYAKQWRSGEEVRFGIRRAAEGAQQSGWRSDYGQPAQQWGWRSDYGQPAQAPRESAQAPRVWQAPSFFSNW